MNYVWENKKKPEYIVTDLVEKAKLQVMIGPREGHDSYILMNDKMNVIVEKKYTSIQLKDYTYNATKYIRPLVVGEEKEDVRVEKPKLAFFNFFKRKQTAINKTKDANLTFKDRLSDEDTKKLNDSLELKTGAQSPSSTK